MNKEQPSANKSTSAGEQKPSCCRFFASLETRVAAVCLFFAVFYAFLAFFKYYALGYYDWDLAFYTQGAWNLVRGGQFVSVCNVNFFANHFCPITFFLLPVFFFFQSAVTLIYLKLIAFILSGYLLARYAERYGPTGCALLILVMYFLFPANLFGLLYEYSPEAFAPPVLFLMLLSLKAKRTWAIILYSFLLVMIKENLSLVAVMFCLVGAFRSREKKERATLYFFAFFYFGAFLLLSLVVVPFFHGFDRYPYIARYPDLGKNVFEILLSPFLHPQAFFSKIFSPWNKSFVFGLFDILLIPALLSPEILVLALPLFLQHFLSSHPPEHTIFFHYGPTLAPFIFVAFIETARKLSEKIQRQKIIKGGAFGFLLLLLLGGISYQQEFLARWNIQNYREAPAQWAMVKRIPADAPVVASFRFLAPLAARAELYSFHMLYDEIYQNPAFMQKSELYTQKPFQLPVNVRYALIDLNDPWMAAALKRGSSGAAKRIDNFFEKNHWNIVQKQGSVLLLAR